MKKALLSFSLLIIASIRLLAQDVTIDATLASTIQTSLNAGSDYTVTATGNIIVSASILKSLGSSATLTLKATKSIVINSGYSIRSTNNALNLVFWSRSGGTNTGDDAGCVWFQVSTIVTSNGGNVTIGGGADPAVGYCVGDVGYTPAAENNANYRGAVVNGTLSAGGGNILIRGKASPSAGAERGVSIGGAVSTMGSGTITITGQSISSSDGLAFGDSSVPGTTGTITCGSGTVTLTGVNTHSSYNSYNGVNLSPRGGSSAYLNCGGNLTINSTGMFSMASATYVNCDGNLSVTSTGSISAASGNLTVTGTSSFSAGTSSIDLTNSNNDFTGNLSISSGTDVTITNVDALALGTINISGLLSARTLSANLTVNNSITTSSTSTSAISLYADYNKLAGDATGGNIIIVGTPSITMGSGGRAKLYTGSISGSTGLSGIVSISYSRFYSDYSTSTFYPDLGSGIYGIYREVGSLVWNGSSGTDWNTAGNWDLGVSPNQTFNTTIASAANSPVVNQAIGTPAYCRNLTINSGAVLTIAAGKALTVNGTLTNNAGNSGLVIQSTSVSATGTCSLIHNTNNVNATIQRYIPGSATLTDKVYHMVSVPLTKAASPVSSLFLGSYLYYFDETQTAPTAEGWVNMGSSTTDPLTVSRGYMIYYPGSSQTYSFAGPMNNGDFQATVSYTAAAPSANKGFNLVPNPYPSAIDWLASSGWTKTRIDNAVYIWNSAVSTSNYASYVSGVSLNGGSQYIAPGQSFFVHAYDVSPALSMTNSVRLHYSTAFLKDTVIIPDLFKIRATAALVSDEMAVRFTDGATPGFDGEWDAYKMMGSANTPQLYSVTSDGINLAINSLPSLSGPVDVPVNFSLDASKEVSFTAGGLESFNSATTICLEDKTLARIVNLRQDPVYTFSYQSGSDADRFILHFNGPNGTAETPSSKEGKAWAVSGRIFLDLPSMQDQCAEISVYDLLGRLIRHQQTTIHGITTIETPLTSGVCLISVTTPTRNFTTKVLAR